MSIITKPYTLSVWKDELESGILVEKKICNIGSNKMTSQNAAFELHFNRNVNGQKKLSFKMYQQYIDNITGEKVHNLFTDLLKNETKVKLYYEDKWYDFIVKNISENSSNYLYTYQLEDALVQELSKNGFGVTLDAKSMNNLGTAKKLAQETLKETNWGVDSEVFVQTVEEALVYIDIPAGTKAIHLKDQTKDNNGEYSEGVTEEDFIFEDSVTVLAFYSCCKNKPHRFQFIYSENGYGKNADDTYQISRKDDRTINEADCQYYIDFASEDDYVDPSDDNGAKSLNLYLPIGFSLGAPGFNEKNPQNDKDSILSSWYRGKRYGFAQQARYVPVLERYCQQFTRNENIGKDANWKVLKAGDEGNITGTAVWDEGTKTYKIQGSKNSEYSGYYLDYDYNSQDTYIIDYRLTVIRGTLVTIGSFATATEFQVTKNGEAVESATIDGSVKIDATVNDIIEVHAEYSNYDASKPQPYIFIQPNQEYITSVGYEITELKVTIRGNYLGYTDSEFISPTFVQNCITNYNFDSLSGWYATAERQENSSTKPKVENICGYFKKNDGFISLIEDYQNGSYDENNTYDSYMKMSFYDDTQFVLNSGIKDNRTMIKNMFEKEEWVLDYQIIKSDGSPIAYDDFDFELGEYIYNTSTGGYNARTGYISFETRETGTDEESADTNYNRKIFTVKTNNYKGGEDFSKNSKIFLKIKPKEVVPSTENDKTIPETWYIKKIALYRKSIGKDEKIIVPDYEATESKSAKAFADSGVIENRYHFFSDWQVSSDNPDAIIDKKQLSTIAKTSLDYNSFIPVYNAGAEKVRTVTAKESNYFNILQSIAETFEAWVELVITRDENGSGAITSKKVRFKNYAGDTNYASFRYGVNLKDITRTCDSKNIATKLIVKTNSNGFGKNGFCTIQRAGANPTGENYIYDFQYYQNQGIMDTNDFLDTVYYIDDAKGKDSVLWEDEQVDAVVEEEDTTLNGYYLRVKKINDAVMPIDDEIIGLQAELVQKKAKKEVAIVEKEASLSGIEQTREDFYILTGVYPEDARDTSIVGISEPSDESGLWPENKTPALIVPQEDWWSVIETNIDSENRKVSGTIQLNGYYAKERYSDLIESKVSYDDTITNEDNFTKGASPWAGLCIENDWEEGRQYKLTYSLELTENSPESLKNIGCHNAYFQEGFSIEIVRKRSTEIDKKWTSDSSICAIDETPVRGDIYEVTVIGTYKTPTGDAQKQSANLWIQPNRGDRSNGFSGILYDIKLQKMLTSTEVVKDTIRTIYFYLNVEVEVEGGNTVPRTQKVETIIPANASTTNFEQVISAVDLERSDVLKYMQQYVTNKEQYKKAVEEEAILTPEVEALEQAIKLQNDTRDQYLEYKRCLNKMFFEKYSRYITEGTWLNEEYTDDDKYYADAQSVLYNSCYPQVSYGINVIFLSKLPGYEIFNFNLGDTTYVIDEDFFGKDKKQEVIITEISEVLDDPSKDSIKFQTFKTQFQDLFQKITATVQQTQYSTGAYERNNALFEANTQKQAEFFQDILNKADTYLKAGATVTEDSQGILVTNKSDPKRQLRLTGGAILLSAEHPETKEQVWRTGLTNEGISADLITAGRLDAGLVQIMSGNVPVFRWDAYGISAYDATWTTADGIRTISGVNSKRFVRFDKNGIYGINNVPKIDGQSWHPSSIDEIDENATFALTWGGLKVTGNDGVEARLGKNGTNILSITKGEEPILTISNDGDLELTGKITAEAGGTIGGWAIEENSLIKCDPENGLTETLQTGEAFIYPSGTKDEYTIANHTQAYWALGIGPSFGVTTDGEMYASAGNIAGWTFDVDSITKGEFEKDGFHMYSSNYPAGAHFGASESQDWALGIGTHFGVTADGNLYAQNAYVNGVIHAQDGGTIAGWNISNDSIAKGDLGSNGFHMSSAGISNTGKWFGADNTAYSWALGIGSGFGVTTDGKLYASGGTFTGTVNASGGYIGSKDKGFHIKEDGLQNQNGNYLLKIENYLLQAVNKLSCMEGLYVTNTNTQNSCLFNCSLTAGKTTVSSLKFTAPNKLAQFEVLGAERHNTNNLILGPFYTNVSSQEMAFIIIARKTLTWSSNTTSIGIDITEYLPSNYYENQQIRRIVASPGEPSYGKDGLWTFAKPYYDPTATQATIKCAANGDNDKSLYVEFIIFATATPI